MRTRERQSLDRLAERELPYIASISMWEAQMLVSRKRLIPSEPFDRWIRRMCASDVVRILPLDVEVVVAVHALPSTFHGDPADRLIVATARTHGLSLATKDRRIRRSRLIQIWKH
jgi:PIN domain nuclease of toxin-antitoxin system